MHAGGVSHGRRMIGARLDGLQGGMKPCSTDAATALDLRGNGPHNAFVLPKCLERIRG
jgi:hypothetical protein